MNGKIKIKNKQFLNLIYDEKKTKKQKITNEWCSGIAQ